MGGANQIEFKYFLEADAINSLRVEITKEEFHRLEKSKATLLAALKLEERYELLVGNYISFEKTLTEYSIENMARLKWMDDHYYSTSFMESLNLNRHIINFLTSARMYMDQTAKDIRMCMGNEESAQILFSKAKSQQYDGCFEYRFMEALRNHVQHFGFPVSQVVANNRFEKQEGGGRWSYTVEVVALKNSLSENRKFPKKILSEMPEKVEIGHALRVYMASISCVQEIVREAVEVKVDLARANIEEAFARFELPSYANNVIRASRQEEKNIDNAEKKEIDSFNIFLVFDDIRKRLQGLNVEMRNLPKRIAANYHKK